MSAKDFKTGVPFYLKPNITTVSGTCLLKCFKFDGNIKYICLVEDVDVLQGLKKNK